MVYFWDALILFALSFNTVFDTIYEFLKVLHMLVEWCVRTYSNFPKSLRTLIKWCEQLF